MANSLDICNYALALIGDKAQLTSIEPPDGSPQAAHCARFYPLARKRLFEEANWGWATKEVELSQIESTEQRPGWRWCYSVPSDCLRVIRIHNGLKRLGGGFDEAYEIRRDADGHKILLTNQPRIFMTYVQYVDKAEEYPAFFVEALALKLATMLVGTMLRGTTGMSAADNIDKKYQTALLRAKELDAYYTRRAMEEPRIPSGIKARMI